MSFTAGGKKVMDQFSVWIRRRLMLSVSLKGHGIKGLSYLSDFNLQGIIDVALLRIHQGNGLSVGKIFLGVFLMS